LKKYKFLYISLLFLLIATGMMVLLINPDYPTDNC
jgi:hypothetical protein